MVVSRIKHQGIADLKVRGVRSAQGKGVYAFVGFNDWLVTNGYKGFRERIPKKIIVFRIVLEQ